MKKVFCKDCKYFKQYEYHWNACDCTHPENILKKTDESYWYQELFSIEYKKKPNIINKNNDCKYFKEARDG